MTQYILHYHTSGALAWSSVPVNKQTFSIGREADNDLVINDPQVSRHHARLQIAPGAQWIIDLNSGNGVTIGATRIPPNQWAPLPPGAPFSLGPVSLRLDILQPAIQPPARAHSSPAPRGVNGRVFAIGGMLLLCICLAVGSGAAAWLIYPKLSDGQPITGLVSTVIPGDQAAPVPVEIDPPLVVSSQPVSAASGGLQDDHGVRLTIPTDVLPVEEMLTFETARLSEGMQQELEEDYTIESLVYSVQAASTDGAGRAALSFPASSSDSRLAVLVEDGLLGILPVVPQDGMLTVTPFLGAPGAAEAYPSLAESNQTNRYFVITPKTSSSSQPGGGPLAIPSRAPDLTSCTPRIWHGNRCWSNAEGSVMVLFWLSEMPADLATNDPLVAPEVIAGVIQHVTSIMTTYQQKGFTNAANSASSPVYVILSAKGGEPSYSPKTGNVYLGWNVVAGLGTTEERCTLAHELFHWVEDEVYAMNAAALVNDKAWFLEMAAENGSYLIDENCTGRTLKTYGFAETNDLLAWQAEPFLWDWEEGSRYIQALQFYISICDGGSRCAYSSSDFSAAINGASYPSSYSREQYEGNADDMGRYLLGNAPMFGRSDAFIPDALRSGSGYGDYIWLKGVPAPSVDFSLNNGRIRSEGSFGAVVNTTIAKGSVYPLWVSNGKGSPTGGGEGFVTLPGMLTIDAGVPLWYSLDNGSPEFHDGGDKLTLGPVSSNLGVGLVRLVATAPREAKTLSAKVEPIDLSGDWANTLSSPTVTKVDCPSSEEDSDPGDNSDAVVDFVAFFSGYGTYVADPAVSDGSHYIWEGQLPENIPAESDITVEPDKVVLKFKIDIPKPESSSAAWLRSPFGMGSTLGGLPVPTREPMVVPAAVLAVLLALVLGARLAAPVLERRRLLLNGTSPVRLVLRAGLVAVVLGGAVWLSGCFGLALWGTFEGTYTYTRIERVDPATAPAEGEAENTELKWHLIDGKADVAYNLHILIETTDEQGNTSEEESVCDLRVEATLDGQVGGPDMVSPPADE